jgi:hypothetical protein
VSDQRVKAGAVSVTSQISAGERFTWAMVRTRAKCWPTNDYYRVGVNDTVNDRIPHRSVDSTTESRHFRAG